MRELSGCQHDPENDLRLFIALVNRGQTPPPWLLRVMADGATEFLKGGKPWPRGKGGRPKSDYGAHEIKAYILQFYCEMTPEQVVGVLVGDDIDGADRARNMRRTIKRGELAFCMAKVNRPHSLAEIVRELISANFGCLSECSANETRAKLKTLLDAWDDV